jgi:hypothetical protein
LPDRILRAAHRRSYVQYQPSVDIVFRGTLPPKQSPAILVVPDAPRLLVGYRDLSCARPIRLSRPLGYGAERLRNGAAGWQWHRELRERCPDRQPTWVAAGKLLSIGTGSCLWQAIPNLGFGVMKSEGNAVAWCSRIGQGDDDCQPKSGRHGEGW